MKHTIGKIFAVTFLWLALSVVAHATTLYFSAQQNTGTQYPQQVGYYADNPSYASGVSSPSSPANYVIMMYFSPWGDMLFEASVDTSVDKGTYYVGSFPDVGADVYVTIY